MGISNDEIKSYLSQQDSLAEPIKTVIGYLKAFIKLQSFPLAEIDSFLTNPLGFLKGNEVYLTFFVGEKIVIIQLIPVINTNREVTEFIIATNSQEMNTLPAEDIGVLVEKVAELKKFSSGYEKVIAFMRPFR
ncbi:hypothetical protein [Endozoicomonas elysicola]|uniref:Uncharacterized protein n=1 Tax=Endozoicomonas elysicola TaxID=305900 RepID=A0A081KAF8_9GAMM|nr:hypothetical protein [Endozoicomonas elysicola]KEI71134.1 hypothetical protein GV64_10595 [Endozoicomonas elysicola]